MISKTREFENAFHGFKFETARPLDDVWHCGPVCGVTLLVCVVLLACRRSSTFVRFVFGARTVHCLAALSLQYQGTPGPGPGCHYTVPELSIGEGRGGKTNSRRGTQLQALGAYMPRQY